VGQEHEIVKLVYEAKESMERADALIYQYMPFIRSETAKFLKRVPIDGYDDELSIAMIAFHEAIRGYSRLKGAFFKYAAMVIRSRLIDYQRREQRHSHVLSLDMPDENGDGVLGDTVADKRAHSEELIAREATRSEIEELTKQIASFGVSLTDVAENCPRQQRTIEACRKAIGFARANPTLIDELVTTKRLPITRLAEGSGVERKTLERHRKYLVTLLLIYSNGYEIIRGHLQHLWKGGNGQ